MGIRIGLIGAGSIANVHAAAINEAGSTLVAVCDLDIAKAEELLQAHAGSESAGVALDTAEAVLAMDEVDAVVVATPNASHVPLACQALEAGKSVLLEKPMGVSTQECRQACQVQQTTGQCLQMGFVTRQSDVVLHAVEALASGGIGEVYHVDVALHRRRGIPGLGGWFTTKAESGGGVLVDIGPHLIDLVLHLLGRPAVLTASATMTRRFGTPIEGYEFEEMWAGPVRSDGVFDVEDGVAGLLRLQGGVGVQIHTNWASNLPDGEIPDGVVLMGTKGVMRFNPWGTEVLISGASADGSDDRREPVEGGGDWGAAFRRQHEHFASTVAGGGEPVATAVQGLEVQAVLEAMYDSAAGGCEVDLRM